MTSDFPYELRRVSARGTRVYKRVEIRSPFSINKMRYRVLSDGFYITMFIHSMSSVSYVPVTPDSVSSLSLRKSCYRMSTEPSFSNPTVAGIGLPECHFVCFVSVLFCVRKKKKDSSAE